MQRVRSIAIRNGNVYSIDLTVRRRPPSSAATLEPLTLRSPPSLDSVQLRFPISNAFLSMFAITYRQIDGRVRLER